MYQPPRFGFRLSEQRLLVTALAGGTDEQLADALGVTLSAVKTMWRAIYDRASIVLTGAGDRRAGSYSGMRGREKKQQLLAYLRDHPEELRPVSKRGEPLALCDLPPEIRRAVVSLEIAVTSAGTRILKYKFVPKLTALELLGKRALGQTLEIVFGSSRVRQE